MSIESLFQGYFQKSRGFLLPALSIRKNSYTVPVQTYISWENNIEPQDRRLICLYDEIHKPGFRTFEKIVLFSNPLFESMYPAENNQGLYVFNFSTYRDDWDHFLAGKYSRFSAPLKRAILKFHDALPKEKAWMDSWLNPEDYFKEYSKLLDVKKTLLIEVGELIDKPDLGKEKLIIVDQNLGVLCPPSNTEGFSDNAQSSDSR